VSFLRWLSLILFLALMAAFFQGVRSWELTAAAAILALILFWTCGAFSRDVWVGTAEQDAEYARIDAELDAIDRAHP